MKANMLRYLQINTNIQITTTNYLLTSFCFLNDATKNFVEGNY